MRKIAVIHEWLASYAGSERVVEQFLLQYPEADLFAVADVLPAGERSFLRGKVPKTSFIQNLPMVRRMVRNYLPLMPMAVEQWDLSAYDLVISSNHAVAKGVITGPYQLHISYVHTPIRYAWEFQYQYLRESNLHRGLRSMFIRAMLHYVRMWDHAAASRVDVFVANSEFIANRIRKCYGRDAEVIYPPVEVDAYSPNYKKDSYYLAASRLVPYKRVDLIIEAFRRMPDRKLLVVGDGPMYKKLKAVAPSNVELLGFLPHDRLKKLMQHAKGFVFAAEEDFGIMPVEAQACATPVIAYSRGGSLETVIDGVTGCFFEEQEPASIVAAIEHFESTHEHIDLAAVRRHAEYFRPERFRQQMHDFVELEWSRRSARRRKPYTAEMNAELPFASMSPETIDVGT